jgi:hypothetical protein
MATKGSCNLFLGHYCEATSNIALAQYQHSISGSGEEFEYVKFQFQLWTSIKSPLGGATTCHEEISIRVLSTRLSNKANKVLTVRDSLLRLLMQHKYDR